MKRKAAAIALTVCMCVPVFTGCTIGDTEYVWNVPTISNDHVFSINESKCNQEEAKLYLCNYQNIYGHEFGVNLWEHEFGHIISNDTLDDYVKDVTLWELASIMCMTQLAKVQGVVLTDSEMVKVERATEEYFNSLSKEEIAYMGIDKSKLKDCYIKYATAQKLFDTLTQGVNEEVSDDEARVMRIQQIYVTDSAIGEEVQKKLQDGDDFATVSSNYNEANTIEKYLKREEYPIEVENVAFNLDNGEQSGMITTSEGCYFIKCVNKYEAEMTEANKINIIAKRRKEQFEDVFQGFVETSEFELNETIWDSIMIDTSGAITTSSFFAVYDKHFSE